MGRLVALVALTMSGAMILAPGLAEAKSKPKLSMDQCVALQPLGPGEIGRTEAVAIPKAVTAIVDKRRILTSVDRLVIQSQNGTAICLDMRRRVEVTNMAIDPTKRFLSFDWAGYEDQGHVIFDRSGAGQAFDTGGRPELAPSRLRMAAVHVSDSSNAELNGLGIWQIGTVGTQSIAVAEVPEMADWRIDRWGLEECIDMSAVPFSRLPAANGQLAGMPRDRFIAKPSGRTWRVTRTTQGCSGG